MGYSFAKKASAILFSSNCSAEFTVLPLIESGSQRLPGTESRNFKPALLVFKPMDDNDPVQSKLYQAYLSKGRQGLRKTGVF